MGFQTCLGIQAQICWEQVPIPGRYGAAASRRPWPLPPGKAKLLPHKQPLGTKAFCKRAEEAREEAQCPRGLPEACLEGKAEPSLLPGHGQRIPPKSERQRDSSFAATPEFGGGEPNAGEIPARDHSVCICGSRLDAACSI